MGLKVMFMGLKVSVYGGMKGECLWGMKGE